MIKRFEVFNLFGLFDNKIQFNVDKNLTVVIGNNGCGKTTMLNMINSIFSINHSQLLDIEYDYIELEMEDSIIKIVKDTLELQADDEKVNIKCLKYFLNGVELEQVYRRNNKLESNMFWERLIPALRRISNNLFRDERTMKIIKKSDLFYEYFDEIPNEIKNEILPIPPEISELLEKVNVVFISTERLKMLMADSEYRRDVGQKDTVELYSTELKNSILGALSNYANLSQKLDEKFPYKILQAIKKNEALSQEELVKRFENIKELRSKHIKTGVLETSNNEYFNSDLNGLDDSTASILTVYYNDTEEKLHALDEISDRISLFLDLINSKLDKRKKIKISARVGMEFFQENHDEPLSLSSLSSGEQQELVLLYQLIFSGSNNKLILIDEPEISLNVNWQREFLNDIKDIIVVNKVNILIATHSPQIINNDWDLVVSLGEVE
ncbi:AAA family ATPase [Lacrimispora sp.]|uniref:AAA family ATPase n=1 Tax=Lacrimispora sp. TaxID=2719234 RepID=UPI0028ACCC42|nr:AAA family ATPase [Lacrimispora sp.]